MFRTRAFRVSSVLVLVAALGALFLARVDASLVERVYARGIFPVIGQALGGLSGRVGWSVTEPGALLAASALIWAVRRGWRRARFWVGLVGVAALVWIGFQAVWGVNYRREPIATAFGLTVRPSSTDELRALAADLTEEINRSAASTPTTGDLPGVLAAAPGIFAAAADRYPFLGGDYAPPKPLVASELLSWLALLGFYNPFTAEPNINVRTPDFLIPYVVLHEMAHARGVASEDEASFVGYLLGRDSGEPRFRYAALWQATVYVYGAWRAVDPEGGARGYETLAPRVQADVAAYAAWRKQHASPLSTLARTVNDTYLRSQGVQDGVQSYGRLTDLVLAEWRTRPR